MTPSLDGEIRDGRHRPVRVWEVLRPVLFVFLTWVALTLIYENLASWANRWSLYLLMFGLVLFFFIFLYSVIKIVVHLYKKRARRAFASMLACIVIVFCFVEPARITNGVDIARSYAVGSLHWWSCIKPAAELGNDARFGFCERHFLSPNVVRLTVYDSSDGSAFPEGSESTQWKKFVMSFEDGDLFGRCSFSSRRIMGHLYFVDFNCEEPALLRR